MGDVGVGAGDRGDAERGDHEAARLGALRDPLAEFGAPVRPADGRRLVLVLGNCQAESLRIVLDGEDVATVRLPPVHELSAAQLPLLERWLGLADALVTQPVRADYRGLPIGTDQLRARLPAAARVLVVPVIRFAGLYPTQAIIRPPHDPGLVPPLVPYHDLVVLTEAAARLEGVRPPAPWLTRDTVRAVAAHSLEQLRMREGAHGAVPVSDLFRSPDFTLARTINHPGNPIWTALAARVRARLGLAVHAVDPRRPLLDAVHAPRDTAVIEAFGLDDEPDDAWRLDGRRVSPAELRDAHLGFYAEHPATVAAGLTRHQDVLALLGLA